MTPLQRPESGTPYTYANWHHHSIFTSLSHRVTSATTNVIRQKLGRAPERLLEERHVRPARTDLRPYLRI